MEKRVFGILALCFLSGCASPGSRRQAQYESGRNRLAESYFQQMYAPECRKASDGPAVPCPKMISIENAPEIEAESRRCVTLKPKAQSNDCKLNELMKKQSAQLQLRYKYADWHEVKLQCDAHPGDCNDARIVEYNAMTSHNHHVMAALKADMQMFDGNYADEVLRARASDPNYNDNALSMMFKGMGQGLQNASQRSISCTTTSYGYSSQTNCH